MNVVVSWCRASSLLRLHVLNVVVLLGHFASSSARLAREGPFLMQLHYEIDYNWQKDNLELGTSYCWSCSSTKKKCAKGDVVWIMACDSSDPKQLFQFTQLDLLFQVDGDTGSLGLFKIAGTDLCLTDDRRENCKTPGTDTNEDSKCYSLQTCATARQINNGILPFEATFGDSRSFLESQLPSIVKKQLFVFDPSARLFEIHPFSLTGYSATQGISYRKCVSNHHHPRPQELIYAQGCAQTRRTDSSYFKLIETCVPSAPCSLCEGVCRRDADCEGGMECFRRSHDETVPGCGNSLNGLRIGRNYCYYPKEGSESEGSGKDTLRITTRAPSDKPTHSPTLSIMSNRVVGDGGVDSIVEGGEVDNVPNDDVEDAHSLWSFADNVETTDDDGLAHEIQPRLTEEHFYCQKVACGICEGDCNDSMSDCAGDLICLRRNGREPIPGCSGQGVKGWDYCVDQLLVNMKTARYDDKSKTWWALP